MDVNKRGRRRGAPGDGAQRAPSPLLPTPLVIPAKAGNLPPPSDAPAPQDPADVPLDRFFIRF